jgi:hypothetical protein
MDEAKAAQRWTLWFPEAAATGLLLGRSRIAPMSSVLVHSPPDSLSVDVTDDRGERVAHGSRLARTIESPMCRLTITDGAGIVREDLWPTGDDLGGIVLLPGGEAGTLLSWWNAADHSAWRWRVEFFNEKVD